MNAESFILTFGASETISLAIKLLVNPGCRMGRERAVSVDAIARHSRRLVICQSPTGGNFPLLELNPSVDGVEVHMLASKQGVIYRPTERFLTNPKHGSGRKHLPFKDSSVEKIEQTAETLGDEDTEVERDVSTLKHR